LGNLTPGAVGKTKVKALTRAEKLAGSLKVCRKDRSKSRRAACEKRARESFGPPRKKGEKK
jgi:hypothetical protein